MGRTHAADDICHAVRHQYGNIRAIWIEPGPPFWTVVGVVDRSRDFRRPDCVQPMVALSFRIRPGGMALAQPDVSSVSSGPVDVMISARPILTSTYEEYEAGVGQVSNRKEVSMSPE